MEESIQEHNDPISDNSTQEDLLYIFDDGFRLNTNPLMLLNDEESSRYENNSRLDSLILVAQHYENASKDEFEIRFSCDENASTDEFELQLPGKFSETNAIYWRQKKRSHRHRKGKMKTSSAKLGLRKCTHCQIEKTPQWREGPLGKKTLCNACGLKYKLDRLLPEYRPAGSPTFDDAKHSNFHRRVKKMERYDKRFMESIMLT